MPMDLQTKRRLPRSAALRLKPMFVLGFWAAMLPGVALRGNPDVEPLQLQEVYDLLKANLAGTSELELNRAAVRGLLDQLSGKVSVVGEPARPAPGATNASTVSASVFEGKFAYIRLHRVTAETDREFETLLGQLRSTNSLKGLVLDLRFTGGHDYGAAVALSDRFLSSEQPLVDWGEGWKRSKGRADAISFPLAILVNRKTTGAAEVLAGILRYRDVGLLIGTNTAGQASMAKEFTLKTGQRLRVAIAPVKVAGGQELPFTGIKPDIEVEVSAEDELASYEDSFKPPPKLARAGTLSTNETTAGTTNRSPRRRLNEAELVRMTRDGPVQGPDSTVVPVPPRPGEAPPLITDPALLRALDLLKGLAVVQSSRSL